jgi:hypothetical protein
MKFALSLALLATASAATSKMQIKKKPITLKGVESNVLMVRACEFGAQRVLRRVPTDRTSSKSFPQQLNSASANLLSFLCSSAVVHAESRCSGRNRP